MRDKAIDCFKGILTVLMVYAHSLQFFVNFERSRPFYYISEYINLTTFPGFMFAFGYAAYLAYLQKPFPKAGRSILKNAGKTLVAFYISSLAFRIFIDKVPYNPRVIYDILFFRHMAGWSEFLASFTMMMIVLLVLFFLFRKVNPLFVVLTFVFSIVMCIIPYMDTSIIVGLIIGDKSGPSFPVLQYLVYFVIGIYFAQKRPGFKPMYLGIAALSSAVFIVYLIKGKYPSRFPPSVPWVLGAMLFLYGYYLLSRAVSQNKYMSWLSDIGKNSLYYLLCSNIIIFAMKYSGFYRMSPAFASILFVVIILIIRYLMSIIRVSPKECAKSGAAAAPDTMEKCNGFIADPKPFKSTGT